jgi:hypothetical protein
MFDTVTLRLIDSAAEIGTTTLPMQVMSEVLRKYISGHPDD